MRSIAWKLSLSFLLVILVGVGMVGFAANLGAKEQFATYLERGPTVVRLDRAVTVLTAYYLENGRWAGAQGLLESLAASQGGRFILTDRSGLVLADSSQESMGRTIAAADLGDVSAIMVSNQEVGIVHLVGASYGSGPWWALFGPGEPRSSTPVPYPQGQGGMMGPGNGHLSPGAMDQMMGAWQSPGSVMGPPEQAYFAGLNAALWLGGIGAALAALALGLVSALRITKPLRRLAEASSKIAAGDLSQRVAVSSRDELGELALSFNSMAETLGRNEETRRHMVSDVAHELRTPLTVLQGNLEGMLDGVVPLDRSTIAALHGETKLLSLLVSDLRELSLAEAGQLKLHRSLTNLASLIEKSARKIASEAERRGIRLDTGPSGGSPLVDLDPDRIGQVMDNLLSNALRHTSAGGRIALELKETQSVEGHWAQVSVTDSGSGISPEDLPLVFERFFRADRSRSRSTGGSGLGLAIVKQLVEAHGGKVWAESQPGQGSAFRFILPLRKPDSGPEPLPAGRA
ncbi:MAG: ATP-binding protein [Dehalococcoidia bacterium]|nr:ATP-binding protein [Dehalococcoidia bacterium]